MYTVQNLIDSLQKVENKEVPIWFYDQYEDGVKYSFGYWRTVIGVGSNGSIPSFFELITENRNIDEE